MIPQAAAAKHKESTVLQLYYMGKLRFRDENEGREDYLILSRKEHRKHTSVYM